ncbi:folylpolyglutamate synthase/dihydrofolate synthase family protein [Chamaesiphon sp. VAR_48_metabat_135_sub]|uniref:bifunctional folylpolyglutamate synthase/dihydrofolate synthase n=1 Tax=Chamaesiphon sp. VAR_48_metabat_135_sub TaxID=2964699 RepID=UPI00286B4173|nr:folylpolyglutamate synthase/dihydrofolate synthase family protein [Chamaesiphon sp. VAR_48_metabat_135_sub]
MNKDEILSEYRKLESEFALLMPKVHFSKENNMKLERIVHLLNLLGNPQDSFASIHITGTAGKGSTSKMVATILTAAGYKTGLHISPYLQVINECYQIDNLMVATSKLSENYEFMKAAIQEVSRENMFGCPSFFEVKVALAFRLFQQEQVDVAVIEVGLGGRLDATNVLRSNVSVLTSVGLDHTEILGDTIELIALEKAGIIKPNQIVISGLTQPSTQNIVAQKCQEQGSTLWQLGQTFDYQIEEDGESFKLTFTDRVYKDISLGMRGDFQKMNAACAVAAVHAFTGGVSQSAVYDGLKEAFLPGRMECIQQHPLVILDGAHNPGKIRAVEDAINKNYTDRRRIVVLSLKSDKDYQNILPNALNNASILIVTAFKKGIWEPLSPEIIAVEAAKIAPNLDIQIESNPIEAISKALTAANPEDLIWVTGSLYLVGDIREYWYPADELIIQAG